MCTRRILSRSTLPFACSAILALPLPALATDGVPPEALSVKVYTDRYVAAGKPFIDLAALESWAKPIPLRAMWLDNCSHASVPQLLAAV